VEEISRKQVIAIIVILILVVASIGFIIASSRPRLMSALEAREIADQAALEWDDNATLCWVWSNWNCVEPDAYAFWDWQKTEDHGDWFFVYYLPTTVTVDNFTYHPRADVMVFSNKSYLIQYDNRVFPERLAPISNWTVDSAEALDIALNNPEVDAYRHDNPNTETGYYLYAYEYPNRIIWNITFSLGGGIYGPMILIHIDANTGEVLLVKVNG
jgi:hypothetical protein